MENALFGMIYKKGVEILTFLLQIVSRNITKTNVCLLYDVLFYAADIKDQFKHNFLFSNKLVPLI
jgi:hypothetical protein